MVTEWFQLEAVSPEQRSSTCRLGLHLESQSDLRNVKIYAFERVILCFVHMFGGHHLLVTHRSLVNKEMFLVFYCWSSFSLFYFSMLKVIHQSFLLFPHLLATQLCYSLDGNVSLWQCSFVQYLAPDLNISTTIRWAVLKSGTYIHDYQRMNPNDPMINWFFM